MAKKRKRVQPEDRLSKVIKILRPAYGHEIKDILKAAALMLSVGPFEHRP